MTENQQIETVIDRGRRAQRAPPEEIECRPTSRKGVESKPDQAEPQEGDDVQQLGTNVTIRRPADAIQKIGEWRKQLSSEAGHCDQVDVQVYLSRPGDCSFKCILDAKVTGPRHTIEMVARDVDLLLRGFAEVDTSETKGKAATVAALPIEPSDLCGGAPRDEDRARSSEPIQTKVETVTTPRGTYVLLASPSEHWEAWLSPREARRLAPELLEAANEIEENESEDDVDNDDDEDPTAPAWDDERGV